jgi:hypothetical protein
MIVVGVLVVGVLVVVAVLSLSGGEAGPLGGIVGDDTPPAPAFEFETGKPKPVSTGEATHAEAMAAAAPAAKAVVRQLDALYTAAYLEPANWMDGDYDDVLSFFAGGAKQEAETEIGVLTAGPEAGQAFEAIAPQPSELKVQVLLDPGGAPYAVEGSVRFFARGTGSDAPVLLASNGQFILEKRDGRWLVVSFSVRRHDEEEAPEPSASATSGTSDSAAPSGTGAS